MNNPNAQSQPLPQAGGEHTPTPQEDKNLLRRFEAYPYPLTIYQQEGCFQISDGSQLWYAFTQKKEHADEIVSALTERASHLRQIEKLRDTVAQAEEFITERGMNGAAQLLAKLRAALKESATE